MSLQSHIIHELGTTPTIDAQQEIASRTDFLVEFLSRSGMAGFVLGISGGQDSLLAGILAQRAVEKRRADGFDTTFHAVLLPYGEQSDRADAELAIATIHPDEVHDVSIKPAVDALASSLDYQIRDFDKGNAKARMRMVAQYAVAAEFHLAVIGTDHAAEAITGFFTKFGDGACDLTPLSGLDKRQGRDLLRALDVPEIFTMKAPTADLLDTTPGRPDENELGISYDTIDDYLEGKSIDPAVAAGLEAQYLKTQHKRTQPLSYTETL